MKVYSADNIRNVCLAGHGGRGKTTLAEAMLFAAGASDRLGKVADGNTVMDFDAEEKRRHNSVSSAVAPLEWLGKKINIIDTRRLATGATARSTSSTLPASSTSPPVWRKASARRRPC